MVMLYSGQDAPIGQDIQVLLLSGFQKFPGLQKQSSSVVNPLANDVLFPEQM
jgi:hypothetical protein